MTWNKAGNTEKHKKKEKCTPKAWIMGRKLKKV
jgi:hypothetical protein